MQKEFPPETTIELTEREREILKLIATGSSNKEIAQNLVISSNTVKVHLRNIFAKIGASSRTEAAMYAVHNGLVKTAAALPNPSTQPDATVEQQSRPLRRLFLIVAGLIILGMIGLGFFLTRGLIPRTAPTPTNQPSPTPMSRWNMVADLPTARSGLAAVNYDNKIYAIGGESDSGVTGIVESYNPQTNSWEKKASKPLSTADINAAVIGGKIYVPGGRTVTGEISKALEIYDPRLDRWEEGPPLPTYLSAYAMVAFEGKLYIFGGWNGSEYVNTVFLYDPAREEWQTRLPMPTRRGFAGAAVLHESIFVVGGRDENGALAVNEAYSPSEDEAAVSPWRRAADMPEGRYGMGTANLLDTIYLVGGKGNTIATLLPISYSFTRDAWTSFEGPTMTSEEGTSLAALGNYLYDIGGKNEEGPTRFTQAYQAVYTIQLPIVPNP